MATLARARRRLAQERGFTLIELMMAAVIGIVIAGVAFGLLDSVVRMFGSSEQRVDVSQRGRLGVDQMSARLRSQVCGGGPTTTDPDALYTPALVEATANKVSFWSNTGDGQGRRLRGIEYTGGVIKEYVYPGADPSATPVSTRELATSVAVNNGGGLFRYFSYNPAAWDASLNPRPALHLTLAPPLSSDQLRSVVRITFGYIAYPENGAPTDRSAADFNGEFLSRTASSPYEYTTAPSTTNVEPRCE